MGTKQRIGMRLLIGLGFKLGFISIFFFFVPCAGLESPAPRSLFSNILRTTELALYFARLKWVLKEISQKKLLMINSTIKEESISL